MSNVTLLQYNNYFNRIIKKEASYANYLVAATANQQYTNVNFVPGDNVRTSIVLGTSALNMSYDYLLVHHTENGNVVIDSRWFIMDENRTRDGQYEVTLKRDVIIDNYNKVIAAPMFIEKGFVSSTTNPILYNKENMTYNQIKDSETLLKDSTTCAWVVGYIPQDAFKNPVIVSKDIPGRPTAQYTASTLSAWTVNGVNFWNAVASNPNGSIFADTSNLSKALYLKYKHHNSPMYVPGAGNVGEEYQHKAAAIVTQTGVIDSFNNPGDYDTWSPVLEESSGGGGASGSVIYENLVSNSALWGQVDQVASEMSFDFNRPISQKSAATIQSLINTQGKVLYVQDTDTYYSIGLKPMNVTSNTESIAGAASANTLLASINNLMRRGGGQYDLWRVTGNHTASDVSIGLSGGNGYMLTLSQTTRTASVEIDSTRNHVLDAPYDMFCIPYSNTKYVNTGSGTVKCNEQLAIGVAQEIAVQAGSQSVYDVQLLPYCPCSELIAQNPNISADNATIDLTGLSIDIIKDSTDTYAPIIAIDINSQGTLDQAIALYGVVYDENYQEIRFYSDSTTYYYKVIASNANTLGAVIWCSSCNRSFDILQTISRSNDPVERKIENECDLYRLCSGNYQGLFEFSAAKSYNGFTGYRVDCTFKPFNPYIHVIPKLTGLYGTSFSSFRDVRGLICGGDFSLAQLSNAWANYELQNKNYQNIFDRQIQTLDLNNSIARQEAGWNIAAGVVGSGVGGAMTGAAAGPVGAIAGAAIGVGSSLIGGAMDYANLEKRQEDAKDYAIDMYGYQLGNIQAIPTSIARNSALTANTKVFPFVEKYTCTATEKQALRDKITYDGMTMMVISTLSAYMVNGTRHFFKGKIIRLDSLGADNHMAQAIYEELYKGVYI